MIKVVIERGKQKKLEDLPPYSVALDGLVLGPQVDLENHRFSLDHHGDKCYNFCTLATSGQMYNMIMLGFDPAPYTFWANDMDIDVCVPIWCAKNIDRCKEPIVKKLVDAVCTMDMHAGAIPINGMHKVVEWISAPETSLKIEGGYESTPNAGLYNLLEAILHRIDKYVDGEAMEEINEFASHQVDKKQYLKILRNENGWVLVESNDPHCYSQLYQAGFDKIVLIRKLQDSLAVSFVKRSEFINFDLFKIYEKINKLEPGAGGGITKGGVVRNPDGSRSKLFFNNIEQLIQIIDDVILNK